MRVDRLWLTDFRSWPRVELAPAPEGITVINGPNGGGKTNLLEAVGWLATLASFRGAPRDVMVREGSARAIVRAEAVRGGRPVLLEAELNVTGRDRVQVNRQPLRRVRDLLGAIRVSVFSPDDLVLVKGGPGDRRRWLDDALVAVQPRHDALLSRLDRVLRQRNTLLRQAVGRLTAEVAATLDVWDAKLAETGEAVALARETLLARLEPEIAKAYAQVAPAGAAVTARYVRSWSGPLAAAVAGSRADDVRRGVSLVGPHRDEVVLTVDGMAARTQASQGEQRSLALALRLAAHAVVTDAAGESPVLLLDDVFSELDAARRDALLAHLPAGQALLTTAGGLPPGASPALVLRVVEGRLEVGP